MHIEDLNPDALWHYYQRGYTCLVRSGLYFRQLLRPALSHVYFQRAVPLLQEYARANHGTCELPPGFGDQLQACPLTPRDLLHLDYAICLGYAEAMGRNPLTLAQFPVLEWPGPNGHNGLFIAADAILTETEVEMSLEEFEEVEEMLDEDEADDNETNPPFDL
jgi:hypothetical protein